jgi:NAD(P)H-hydrate epimerase
MLMENAGANAARLIAGSFCGPGKTAVILCGAGNNGGDGFVVARHLYNAGHVAGAVLVGDEDRLTPVCRANFGIMLNIARERRADRRAFVFRFEEATGCIVDLVDGTHRLELSQVLCTHDCIVDALLGTGLRSDVTGAAAGVIDMINRRSSAVPVWAIDVPSGLNSDTGIPNGGAVKATATVTLGVPKAGLYTDAGAACAGEVMIAGIGAPDQCAEGLSGRLFELFDKGMARALLPRRGIGFHKGDAGHLLVVAGSPDKPGAALLACRAAMRAGAGLCTLAAPLGALSPELCEVMGTPLSLDDEGLCLTSERELGDLLAGKDAVAIGPGIPRGAGSLRLILSVLGSFKGPVVLDAEALNIIADHAGEVRMTGCQKVLTPHPGEMGRLLGISSSAVQGDRFAAASRCALAFGSAVLLKGARSVACPADSATFTINPTGNPGMASGGMGDVLTGVIGSLAAQGVPVFDCARLGAYIHGLAGDIAVGPLGESALIASDVIEALGAAFRRVNE